MKWRVPISIFSVHDFLQFVDNPRFGRQNLEAGFVLDMSEITIVYVYSNQLLPYSTEQLQKCRFSIKQLQLCNSPMGLANFESVLGMILNF